jgi:hypothetical protein
MARWEYDYVQLNYTDRGKSFVDMTEYQSFLTSIRNKIAEFGANGWEAVGEITQSLACTLTNGNAVENGNTVEGRYLLFKRELSESSGILSTAEALHRLEVKGPSN